jgi:four helix bundle protein
MNQFDFERLDVYAHAVEFLLTADEITSTATRPFGDAAHQLTKASLSILTNLCEGAGEFSRAEKARFYRLARRSAAECAGIVAAYRRLNLCDAALTAKAKKELVSIVSMLVGLIHSTERTKREPALNARS